MEPESILVILGSSRKNSDTGSFLKKVMQDIPFQKADLLDFQISSYNYSGHYPESDEFHKVANLILQHQHILFATPVYWYSMSGLMKTLFDRFTDLVTSRKEEGRLLQGKSTSLLAVGADEELPTGFVTPFQLTSRYLNMNFTESIYHSTKYSINDRTMDAPIRKFRSRAFGSNSGH